MIKIPIMNKILLLIAIMLTFQNTLLQSNPTVAVDEICYNGIDDDGDGLTDCADPDCEGPDCEDALPCSNTLYQVVSGVLRAFDPLTSSYSDVGDSGMGSYNGAGYNVEDGYIYGIKAISGKQHVVKINSSGTATDYGAVSNFSGITYSADIDVSGNWIAYTGGANPQLRRIDLDQFPLTMEFINLTNLFGANIPNCADVTFNPVTQKLYGMSSNRQVIEIDVNTLTADVVADYDGASGGFGAAWSDIEGNSYFSHNGTGEIYRVSFDGNENPTGMNYVAQGTVTNNNDGINCVLSLPPLESNCSDGIDNDGDGLVDGEDPDCIDAPEFTEVDETPTTDLSDSWGIAWVDYNNDCYDDLFVPSYDKDTPSALYLNDGDGTFTKITSSDLVTDLGGSLAATWADFDNDGYKDVAIANNVDSPNFLYQNTGTGFTSVEGDVLTTDGGYAHGITFVDYDNDGFVDIFVSDYFESEFNKLYHNKGDGTFERITAGILVNDAVAAIGSTWGDVNGDGWADAFVPVNGGSNILYLNNGDRTFTKVLMDDNAKSVGCSFGDYDNDGDLDLFVTNASKQDNFLYNNDGNGNFTRITTGFIATDGGDSHGSAWGDFDNDGWLDLYVTNDRDAANMLYMNSGDGTFGKVVLSPLVLPIGNSFGVATADYNNDGALDIAVANHSAEKNDLYLNEPNGANYINILLEGTNSNASALGTKVYVTATIDETSITQMREVSAQTGGGPGSQNSFTQHFGLGNATTIDEIRIEWTSGYVQTETNIPINEKRIIQEEDGSVISGTVYNDINGNCIKDAGETGLPNTIINVNNDDLYAITDENGYYEVYVAVGSYSIGQEVPDDFTNICSPSYSVNVSGIGLSYPNNDFPNQTGSQLPKLCVDMGATALRRGFENDIIMSYSNYGVAVANNVILTLTLEEDVSVVLSDTDWNSSFGNTYTWNLGTLAVNESGSINILNYVDLNANIDTYKTFSVNISSDEANMDTNCASTTISEKVVGAVDPNDILVSPMGFGPAHYIQITDTLTYRIRFQNVGNYPATFINIVDTLSEHLDMTTFVPSTASHSYELTINDDGTIHWFFDEIYLADSVNNEPESHGFVQFKILPKRDLNNHTIINNKASIKFDYNYPVVTNTVFNTIDFDLDERDQESNQLFIYPNPAQGYVQLFLHKPYVDKYKQDSFFDNDVKNTLKGDVELYTLSGKHISSIKIKNNSTINVKKLNKGVYLLVYIDENNNKYVEKIIKQ